MFHGKRRIHDEGLLLPTEVAEDVSRCFCGTRITIATTDDHIRSAHCAA